MRKSEDANCGVEDRMASQNRQGSVSVPVTSKARSLGEHDDAGLWVQGQATTSDLRGSSQLFAS